jgi:hypothetical protein
MYASVLRYAAGRYLWTALALTGVSFVLFELHTGSTPRGGDTWEGYTLGTIGALLIVWLTTLGIRKRAYASTIGTVAGWTSAHVYLGLALLVIATLHCAGHFGWNVHTLAYALMVGVIVTGMLGVGLYLLAPPHLLGVRQGYSRAALFAELAELNATLHNLADRCRAEVALAVHSAIDRTTLGGGAVAQLIGSDHSWMLRTDSTDQGSRAVLVRNRDQQGVMEFVSTFIPRSQKSAEAKVLQDVTMALGRRQVVLRHLRRDIRLNGWLTLWLYVHVPLTFALVAALTVHILVTFIYW